MEAVASYGPIKIGQVCKVAQEGRDWYRITLRGKPIYVPKWVFRRDEEKPKKKRKKKSM